MEHRCAPDRRSAGLMTLRAVSSRLDKSWRVLARPSTATVDRCVDIFLRPNGTFGFEELRRDREDMGAWTAVAYLPPTSDAEHGIDSLEATWSSVRGDGIVGRFVVSRNAIRTFDARAQDARGGGPQWQRR
jgi:hypothetical protein